MLGGNSQQSVPGGNWTHGQDYCEFFWQGLMGKGANIEPDDMKDLDAIQQENFKDFDDCMKKGADKC